MVCAGKDYGGQVVAANVDVVFVVTTLGRDFNLRRLERYLTLVSASGAAPCLLLTKADLCPDIRPFEEALGALSPPVPFIVTSAHSGAGVAELCHLPLHDVNPFVLIPVHVAGPSRVAHLQNTHRATGIFSRDLAIDRRAVAELHPVAEGGFALDEHEEHLRVATTTGHAPSPE